MILSARSKVAAAITVAVSVSALLGGAVTAQAIVGGKPVTKDAYAKSKFVVQITAGKTRSGKVVRCGGVLVAPQKVVTSFACLDSGDGQMSTTKVIGGRKDLNGKDGIVSGVTDAKNSADFYYTEDGVPVADVAVLTLAKKMPYTPVKLVPTSFKYKAGTKARILGWGDAGAGTSDSNQLREGKIDILSNSACQSAYNKKNFQAKSMVCGGKKAGGVDTCNDDMGGPLLVTQGGKEYLAGIASWGYKDCGKVKYPGVYTRISAFRWVAN